MSRDILLGVVIGAQGLKGEVKVKTFTQSPERLGAYGALHAKDGREFRVVAARAAKSDIAVVRLEGVIDRNDAEKLKGVELYIARDVLPPPDEEEFYHADLIGLAAHDAEGRVFGTVSGVHNFGAGDVIAIARADGGDMFLPFTHAVVPTVDVKSGFVVVAVPEEAEDDQDWRAGP
jgi:16S rRNA processing protein RimM